jgi:hypothetical protein
MRRLTLSLTAQCSTHSDILSLVVFLSQLKACSL